MTMINSRKILLHLKETLCALVCVCVHAHVCADTCSRTSDSLQDHGQTVVHQAPLSMGFACQETGGVPFPPPGALPNPGIEPVSPANQVDSLPLSHQRRPYPLLVTFYFLQPSETNTLLAICTDLPIL